MKAHLRSVRIAPKKANIIAKMVRGMPVGEAMTLLKRTHKKGARIVETLLESAVANARHNDKQHPSDLVIKSIIVNQGMGLPRGVPMARGRIRTMTKFMSHIDLALGVADGKMEQTQKNEKNKGSEKNDKKAPVKASQESKSAVKASAHPKKEKNSESTTDPSSTSSPSSKSSPSS